MPVGSRADAVDEWRIPCYIFIYQRPNGARFLLSLEPRMRPRPRTQSLYIRSCPYSSFSNSSAIWKINSVRRHTQRKQRSRRVPADENSIFKLYSLGVSTNRDEWVFDVDSSHLAQKMKFFTDVFNADQAKILRVIDTIKAKSKTERDATVEQMLDLSIKWSSGLKANLLKWVKIKFSSKLIVPYLERPYCLTQFYAEKAFSDRLTSNHTQMFGDKLELDNSMIALDVTDKPFSALASKYLVDLHFNGDSQCLPLYRYDNGNRLDNITDYALHAFQTQYSDASITRQQIFAYTYAVLHHPAYRAKYALNLRQEFPRIPYYADFAQSAAWGDALLKLHLEFETADPYPLQIIETAPDTDNPALLERLRKAKLKADHVSGEIVLDGLTSLRGVPSAAWQYRLGNRSALEWILERYRETTPKDPTIRERFNTYQFRAYKAQVIDSLRRVCTVSVETMRVLGAMPQETL